MKPAIIDANYAKDQYRGMAALWLGWELERAGIAEVPAAEADILLCTVSSQQGIGDLRRELRKVKRPGLPVVLGGGGCYAPAIFEGIADVICVGEGARFMRVLLADGLAVAKRLPEAWVEGDARPVIPNPNFPWELPPLNHPDGIARIFGSRGCKYKCLFCQTGWETRYAVNPDSSRLRIQAAALKSAGRKISVVTNDGAETDVALCEQSEFLSMRFSNLKRLMPITRAMTKGVRIGVEGVSERLRTAVGKPVGNEDLARMTYDLFMHQVGVRWFFVPGLPGETETDYGELRELILMIKRVPKGAVMMNFHAFIPQPAAPLSIFPLVDEYWEPFDEFRRWFFHGPGFTRHVQIVAPCKYPGRLKRAMESMAATEAELRRGWWQDDNRNWRVQYMASPDGMRRIASIYAGKIGLEGAVLQRRKGCPAPSVRAAPQKSNG